MLVLGDIAEAATEPVLPLPPAVRALPQVSGEALGPDLFALREVLGDLLRGFLQRGERLMGAHEIDDLAHTFGFEPVADVDEGDRHGSFGVRGRETDRRETPE